MGTMETVYGFLISEQDPEVRESAFAFFYLIANAIGSRFEMVFDKLIPIVLKACEPREVPQKAKDLSLDTDSEDENDVKIVAEKATEHDEKAAAIHALGEFAKACSLKFVPYFETAYRLLDEHYQHFYNNIRIQVCHCYTNLTLGLVRSMNGGNLPTIKKGLPCVDRYPANLEEIFNTKVVPRLVWIMNEDDEKQVRGAAAEATDDLVKELGPAFIDRNLPALVEAVMKLLEADIEEDDEEEDDHHDHEEDHDEETEVHTYEAVCDLIPTLAENLLSGFEPSLSELRRPSFIQTPTCCATSKSEKK
jgi:importin-4